MIIRKVDPAKTAEKEQKNGVKKRESGLGRGLESLLEDNTPDPASKPSVVRRDPEDKGIKRTDDLYKKEGVLNVKKNKRTWP